MIEKVSFLDSSVNCVDYKGFEHNVAEGGIINKINELVDAVNNIVSVQEKLVDCFVVKTKQEAPVDKYAEQRKWIGKICKFWNDDDSPDNVMYGELVNIFDVHKENCPFQCGYGEWYEHCEPVKPDDDIIYKGEQ